MLAPAAAQPWFAIWVSTTSVPPGQSMVGFHATRPELSFRPTRTLVQSQGTDPSEPTRTVSLGLNRALFGTLIPQSAVAVTNALGAHGKRTFLKSACMMAPG